MVKLFLFRLGSLLSLLVLLVWEAFYRQNAVTFTGMNFGRGTERNICASIDEGLLKQNNK